MGIMLTSVLASAPMYSNSIPTNQAFAQTPSDVQDIGNYVVYGLEEVKIDKNVTIQSGNIGLHDDSKKKGEIKIKKDVVFVDSEISLVANKIKIEKDAVVPNVFYNELDNKGEILGTENTPLVLPVVTNLPEFPDFESGNEKIKVDKKIPVSLPPGDYAKIELKKNSMIIFEGGVYNIESMKAGKDSQILFSDSSEVRVKKDIKLDKMVTLGPHPDSDISASDVIFFVGDDKKSKIEFGKSSVIHGVFFSPNGEIKMKKGVDATGSFIANKIKIEKDVTLTLNSGDISVQNLVDEYLGLIEKLNVVGSNLDQTIITQELIDELQGDLDRIKQIVIELQMNGYDGQVVPIRHDTQMVGIVTFFDENTLEVLFEKQIPDHTLGIFGQVGLINEFANDDVPLTFEEQRILLREGFELVSVITNTESDEIASLFVLASILAFHPSTGNTFEGVTLSLGVLKQTTVLLREGLKACLKNIPCQNKVKDLGTELGVDGIKFLQKIINERWFSILISGFVFNDLNNNASPNFNERMPNESFEIIYAHTARDISGSPLILSDIDDGSFVFDPEIIYAPYRDITVNPTLSESQIVEGWVKSTPEFRFTIPQDIPPTNARVLDDVEIGMVKLATLRVSLNVNGGPLQQSDFEIVVIDNLSNEITKQGKNIPFVEFRILEGGFSVDVTPQPGYSTRISPLGCTGTISIESPPIDDCVIDMDFVTSPPTSPIFPIAISDVSPKNGGNACNINNAKTKDGAVAGLDYKRFGFGTGGLGIVPGTSIFAAGCIAADFGSVQDIEEVTVTAGRDYNACGAGCFGGFCNRATEKFIVFQSTTLQSFSLIGRSPNLPQAETLNDYSFTLTDPARYVTVCRGGAGPAASDVMVDAIVAGTGSASLSSLAFTPPVGGPYFYLELDQSSVIVSRSDTVTIPLEVEWDSGFYATDVNIQINNMTSGVSVIVDGTVESEHYKLFNIIFDVTPDAQIGEHIFEVLVEEIDSGFIIGEIIQFNVN